MQDSKLCLPAEQCHHLRPQELQHVHLSLAAADPVRLAYPVPPAA